MLLYNYTLKAESRLHALSTEITEHDKGKREWFAAKCVIVFSNKIN